jgi:putative MATE family efflux protein
MGLSMGATAIVARRTGEGDHEGASVAAVQVLAVALVAALVIGVAGALYGERLLVLMGADPEVSKLGAGYARLMLGGNVTIVGLFVLNAIFRGAGDAALAMRSLWVANAANILLGPCFIFGLGPLPELGVTGAAVATNIGRGMGVGFQLYMLSRDHSRVRVAARHLRLHVDVVLNLLRVAGTGTVQMLIETASWLGLVRILASFGSAALAGYTIAIRIATFVLLPSWGMANAAATLVGQNLGAGKPERAEQSVWAAGRYNFVFLGLVSVLFIAMPEPLVRFFTSDTAVIRYGNDALRIIAFGFLFYAYGMVLVQAFNGSGDTLTPMLLNIACFWCVKIPVAYLLAMHLHLGPRGVFIAITLAYSTLATVAAVLFRRGRWKASRV